VQSVGVVFVCAPSFPWTVFYPLVWLDHPTPVRAPRLYHAPNFTLTKAPNMSLKTKNMTDICSYLRSPVIHIVVGHSPNETKLAAHLALLQKSPWFADACSEYSHATPDDERIVKLLDEDLGAVGSFLEYLYVGEYNPRLLPGPSGKPEDKILEATDENELDEAGDNLLKHAKVYTLAEKLQLPELKHLAHSKIHRINSTARGELRYAKFVYENTTKDDKTIRQPIASFWAHRSEFNASAIAHIPTDV